MTSQIITIYCKVLLIRDSQYQEIIVEDLNRDYTDDLKYILVVKLPNWNTSYNIEVGDIGYLQLQYVEGGITKWFNKQTKDFEIYNYTNNYFINFFKEKEKCKQDKFNFE